MPAELEIEPELEAALGARKKALKRDHLPNGVYQCIIAVSADLVKEGGISKDRSNTQQGYKFRGIDDVMNALAPLLVKHGLLILPRCLSREVVERQSKGGGALFSVTVEAEFQFLCVADGTTHNIRMYGEAMDSADKATNKAMSAAYKYAALQTFCIPTEGEDADKVTPEVVPQLPPTGPGKPWRPFPAAPTQTAAHPPTAREGLRPPVPSGGDSDPDGVVGIYPEGAVLIEHVERKSTRNPKVTRYLITTSTGEVLATIKDKMGTAAELHRLHRTPVFVESESTQYGQDLVHITVAELEPPPPPTEIEDDSIPF